MAILDADCCPSGGLASPGVTERTSPGLVPPPRPLSDEGAFLVARALAHPARKRILQLLGEREGCYCGDLCEDLPLAQSTISQHLKILREAGLIEGSAQGTSVCYCVVEEQLHRFAAWVRSLAAREPPLLDFPLQDLPLQEPPIRDLESAGVGR